MKKFYIFNLIHRYKIKNTAIISIILTFALLPSCFSKSETDPQIQFISNSFKIPADSVKVGARVNLELRCISNGNDLLTKLHIFTNAEKTLEEMYIRPPAAAFGYQFSFTKTKAETDSITFQLQDKSGNTGSILVLMHTKPK